MKNRKENTMRQVARRIGLLVLFIGLATVASQAQTAISGQVTNEGGEA